MHIRDRIIELRRVPAGELRPNPKNWRTHPPRQQDAMRGVLAEIGYADALLARLLPDGGLELVDGHLRAETTPEMTVPVLVLDLTAAEADKLLAVLDPLAALAECDDEKFSDLAAKIETDNAALQELLDEIAAEEVEIDVPEEEAPELEIPEVFQVVVECNGEEQQRKLYEQLTRDGYACRLLML